MKFFILEDDPNRVKWMKENFHPEITLDITDLAETGMKWLRENEYDAIFLDHDLGGDQMVSSEVWNTGATVARMVHETKNKGLTVIVHSYNPSGAEIMIKTLRGNGVRCYYQHFQGKEFIDTINQINKQVEDGKNEKEKANIRAGDDSQA
jgi:DNA-binding response OmpR family regulator